MLSRTEIPFHKTRQFSRLFLDYVAGTLDGFHRYPASFEGIHAFTEENKYETLDRAALAEELLRQNSGLTLSASSRNNIEALAHPEAYTIVTGHQLCLATGPLYFIYKILSAINLAEELGKKYPARKFVPVYWMASEDHDFEEVNHINLFSKAFSWQTEQKGSVGSFRLDGITGFLADIRAALGENANAADLIALLEKAYSLDNLAAATRYLVNELFGKFGLVIVDGNSVGFKRNFIPEIKRELFNQFAFVAVNNTIERLKQLGYEAQVSPREINLFYVGPGYRERIVADNGLYKVLNTEISFSAAQLEAEIDAHPERFSPNVVLRPLYQQKILPNAAYVGGPGELAYWLEYRQLFEDAGIPFPVLVPRNFVAYVEKGLQQRMDKLGIKAEDLYLDKDQLLKSFALKQQPFDLEQQKDELKNLFEEVKSQVTAVDKTLSAAAEAELQKALKAIETLEQKAVRSIKQKSEQSLNQVEALHARFFPGGTPQERVDNFMRYYLGNPHFIDDVKAQLVPFSQSVLVLTEQ